MKEIPVFQSDGIEKKNGLICFFVYNIRITFKNWEERWKIITVLQQLYIYIFKLKSLNTILLYEHYKYHRYKKS